MENKSNQDDPRSIDYGLPPDIVLATLPYLEPRDIKNLSLTNKYFYKLLDYGGSNTLWHELYRKAFGYTQTNEEPFSSNGAEGLSTCSETVLVTAFPDMSWMERYKARERCTRLYTWGSQQHGRLGYTLGCNPMVSDDVFDGRWGHQRVGISKPTLVPWFTEACRTDNGEPVPGLPDVAEIDQDDRTIVQMSAGGFSFQLLTKSGKLYFTGITYTGGHPGPGPKNERDYNYFRNIVLEIDQNRIPDLFARNGMYRHRVHNAWSEPVPHDDLYRALNKMKKRCLQHIPGNRHVQRLLARDSLSFYHEESAFAMKVDPSLFDKVKFVSVTSGRSHILALDDNNNLYSWDGPDIDYGVRIVFEGLPVRKTNPLLKIGSGWDFNCVYIYAVGLVVWSSRSAVKKGDTFAKANYNVIPDTADISGTNRISDYACCANNVVFYITNNGRKLWIYSHGVSKTVDLPFDGRLTKIEASCMTLVLCTENSTYTLKVNNGDIVEDSFMKMNLEQGQKFIAVSAGDYHNLALTDKGELYSWGLESDICGCLGQGDPDEAVDTRQIATFESARSIRVLQPAKVELPANSVCVAITAGGWHSAALIMQNQST
ncbi:AEL155Cp [Eremothecium gossypii ATCC 10895]|uniref:AEL155Cp n=1 Tax=Eremothecium gossypii (strain ATCC 10895 / CBS 109.51 / FGSC 9923 / NRRL Y-1056) TaxID=284811 RepID=Q758A7_EREGS|nr:AEL155Cp [Eremothecium gossypii ATCC 10895]AAS52530.1 AEL155Cp [Eremothecium gossypii ATCC 10895]AEY96830.1 FAEL155Cp [Eremothecium gossypii FDAG1]